MLAGEDFQCPDWVWIACGVQTRLPDGSVTQRYLLRAGGTSLAPCGGGRQWQAFYRSTPNGAHQQAPVQCDQEGPFLEINARTNTRLELMVVGQCGDTRYTARMLQGLFGKASPDKKKDAAPAAQPSPDLPRLQLQPLKRYYYMQTGEPYRFTYSGDAAMVADVWVMEEGRRLALRMDLAPDGVFSFTPAHDLRLDRTSPYAVKETVVLVRENGPHRRAVTAFTLLLHRSFTAHLRLLPGLGVLGAAAAASLALVLRRKRRPWYA